MTSDFKQALARINFEPVLTKVCLPFDQGGYGWPRKQAIKVLEDYQQFLESFYVELQKPKAQRKPVSPTPVVDILWHTHILFTEKYHRDCQILFNQYFHHRPTVKTELHEFA